MRQNYGEAHEWNLIFVRGFNDWEVDVVAELFHFLTSHTPTSEGPDGIRWKLRKDGALDSRSFYYVLTERPDRSFPCRSVWTVKAPPRVSFFVWTAAWKRILTYDNLMRRGYTLAGWCCMCQRDGETVDHLLLHYHEVSALWSFCLSLF